MKKRVIALLLVLVAAAGLVLPVSGETPVEEICFVAYNDTLPLTLPFNEWVYQTEGTQLVSHNAFTVSGPDISAVFDSTNKTLQLYTRNSRLKFELTRGKVTDEKGNVTDVVCTYRNTTAYIPLDFCVAHFGLQYSFLTSIDGYNVLRLTNGQQTYSDSKFIDRAENLIDFRVQRYLVEKQNEPDEPEVSEPETPAHRPVEGYVTAYLAICGAENMEDALPVLTRRKVAATFFLTAEEMRANPSLMRQIAAAGYPIGLTVGAREQDVTAALADANRELDAVLHKKTLLALLTEEQTELAQGYCTIRREAASTVYEAIATDEQCLILCNADTYQNVLLLSGASANFRLLRETSPFS